MRVQKTAHKRRPSSAGSARAHVRVRIFVCVVAAAVLVPGEVPSSTSLGHKILRLSKTGRRRTRTLDNVMNYIDIFQNHFKEVFPETFLVIATIIILLYAVFATGRPTIGGGSSSSSSTSSTPA